MAAPVAKVAAKVSASPEGRKALKFILYGLAGLVFMMFVIVASIFGPGSSGSCGDGSGSGAAVDAGTEFNAFGIPGDLGKLNGTGITSAEFAVVKAGRTQKITPGTYMTTAYGPPWGGIQGAGVSTSAGLRINGGSPHKYFVAVDPSMISYGSWVYIWPNPFKWRGPFLAADTGGAIQQRRIDFYDWRGRAAQNGWGRREATVSARPSSGGGDANDPSAEDLGAGNAPSLDANGPILVVGDSLAVGTKPLLAKLIPNRKFITDAVIGRPSPGGLAAVRRHARDSRTWVIQLGTNDGNADELRSVVRKIRRLASDKRARLLWVNVYRKHVAGLLDTREINDILSDELGNDQIINWVDIHPVLADGIHPNPAWYQKRAKLIADAIGNQDTGSAESQSSGTGQCADGDVQLGTPEGDAQFAKIRRLTQPRKFVKLPKWATAKGYVSPAVPNGQATVDARIAPNVLWLMERYDARVHDCLASGHNTHGTGDSCDIVPAKDPLPRPKKNQAKWATITQLAKDLGWKEPGSGYPGGYACNSGMPFKGAQYIICYNGDLNHGDPEHEYGGCACPHIHLTWNNPVIGSKVPMQAPPAWVDTFIIDAPKEDKPKAPKSDSSSAPDDKPDKEKAK